MKHLRTYFLFAATATLLHTSCKREIDGPDLDLEHATELVIEYIDDSLRGQFNAAVIGQGGCIQAQPPIPFPQQNGTEFTEEQIQDDQTWSCTNQPMLYGPQFSEVSIFSPNEVVWVGSYLQGNTLSMGSWTPVVYDDRRPYNVTVSLTTQAGTSATAVVSSPSLSSYVAAHNQVVQNAVPDGTAANMTFLKREVHAREEVNGHIGASFGGWGASISGSYDWSSSNSTSKYLLKLVQSYYTVAVDIPAAPADWFGTLPSYEQMASYCPVYISNITYGRTIYVTIETQSSMDSLAAAINAAYSGFGGSGTFNWNCNEMQSLRSTQIEGFVVGGSAGVGAVLIASGNINQAIIDGAQYSPTSPGMPIAFTVRRLSDNSVVDFVTLSEYTVQECTLVGTNVNAQPLTGAEYKWFCPLDDDTDADGEFGGACIVTGNLSLEISLDRRSISAVVEATFSEPGGDFSHGYVNPEADENKVLLYEAPSGKVIASLGNDQPFTFNQEDNDHQPHTYPATSSFVHSYIINGDTGGGDIGNCSLTDEDSYLRVRFKSFVVTLVDG